MGVTVLSWPLRKRDELIGEQFDDDVEQAEHFEWDQE